MSDPLKHLLWPGGDSASATGPALMGILNITPDSFSDGGELAQPADVVARAQAFVADGATWLDLGAESTRPHAAPVCAQTELERLLPALQAVVRAELPARISIDTRRSDVARAALAAGAHAINDVSALGDPAMAPLIAQAQVPIVLMHWAGPAPVGGSHGVEYGFVVEEVCTQLAARRDAALAAGIARHNIWLDPGLGFGKDHEHALALTRHLDALVALGHPVVYGPSRKRFLQHIVGRPSQACDAATAAACCVAVMQGAQVLRVHSPAAVADAARVGYALSRACGVKNQPK